jgi:glycosyltransferase involved in cell wall biosynthesis
MNLAYFSPLQPERSGISDYSEELLPHLAAHAHLDLFIDDYIPSNPAILDRFAVHPAREYDQWYAAGRFDAAIYHLGNSRSNAFAYRALRRRPGIVVLHDYILHHLVVEMTLARGDAADYVREMVFAGGREAMSVALDVVLRDREFPYGTYPLNERVVDSSLGTIVHSEFVRRLLISRSPAAPVAVVRSHALPGGSRLSRSEARRSLGIDDETLLIGSYGLASPAKRLDVVLRVYSRVRARLPRSRFVVVGEVAPEVRLAELVRSLGLEDHVEVTGYVEKEQLLRYIAASDLGVNLRWPTMGETSASLLRLMAAGVPALVSNVGAFAEFPNDCCLKVPVDEFEEDRIAELFVELAGDPVRRNAIGATSRCYVHTHHSIERSAADYIAAIERILG